MPEVMNEIEKATTTGLLPAQPVEVLLDCRPLVLLGALAEEAGDLHGADRT
jgi:hypothetical protein